MNNITKNSLKKISLYLSVLGFFVSTFFFTALPHHAHADNTVNLIPGSLNLYAGNDVCNTKKIEAADAIRKTPGLTKDEKDARVAESDKTIEAECYQFLEPLPAVTPDGANAEATAIQITPTEGIGASFNNMYSIAIGIGSVVAVVMIVIYGFKYMTSESGGGNLQKLKSRITNVVLGLLLLVGIYVILNTINPNLLDVQPDVGKEFIAIKEFEYNELAFEGDGDYTDNSSPGTWGKGELLPQVPSVYCPGKGGSAEIRKIVASFENKVTYRFGGKGSNTNFSGKDAGKSCPSNTLCLDCSGFTNQVHRCAGIPRQGGGTANIFGQPGAEPIKTYEEKDGKVIVNGKELKPGDTFGKPSWHIFIYLGEGQFAESTSNNNGRTLNQSMQVTTSTLTKTAKRKTGLYVKRI